MFWSAVAHLAALLVDLAMARRQPGGEEDPEILLPRHQFRVVQRQPPRPRRSRWGS
ncbi:MAG: hypothetical protein M3Q65_20185 [Chloroflexota bacterium]|nr:hypothetical protein [Chloroflexota bacterium]